MLIYKITAEFYVESGAFMKREKKIKIAIEQLAETDSTNDYLAKLCNQGNIEEFYTERTEYQTSGKGQRGNSWESEPGKNLLFSFVFYPTALEAKSQFNLSMLVATGLVDALSGYTDGFSIKWPNDIYWKDQKIAGILIENMLEGKYISQCIVGIGLNVNQTVFHSSAPNPISLAQIIGKEIDREELFKKDRIHVAEVLDHLDYFVDAAHHSPVVVFRSLSVEQVEHSVLVLHAAVIKRLSHRVLVLVRAICNVKHV